jgi:hypothetical protein
MLLLQTTIGSSILQLINPNSIITILVEIGVLYIAYREFKIKTEKNIEALINKVEDLEKHEDKINILENNSNLLSKDIDYLKNESKNTIRLLEKLDEKQMKFNEDIHKIKGSSLQIEMYLKQVLEGKL